MLLRISLSSGLHHHSQQHRQQRQAVALTVAVAVACIVAVCCPGGCHGQATTPTPLGRQRFLGALWGDHFGLGDGQRLAESNFLSTLASLRIGGYYSNCSGTAAHSNATATATADAVNACLSGSAITEAFGFNLSLGLTREQLSELSIALVQQQLAGGCVNKEADDHHPSNGTETARDIKWAYIYGTISVAAISLLSCVGCILVTCYRASCFQHLMLFLVELAVGSLVGEALLHLLPTVLAEEEGGGHDHHEEGGGVSASFLKLVAAAATVCLMHAIDTGSCVCGLGGHSHDDSSEEAAAAVTTDSGLPPLTAFGDGGKAYSVSTANQAVVSADASPRTSLPPPLAPQADGGSGVGGPFSFVHSRVHLPQLMRCPKLWLRYPVRLSLFILLGDALHNFADGVAIGAAFALSDGDGLRLSLTVGLHELAHEIADFAVLLSCGFSVRAAVLLNLLCTVTCFIGLYVAVPLSEASHEVQAWILAITAAMFLYIALVTMTSLVRRCYRPKSTVAFVVGNLGLMTGFLLVIAISMYEFYG